MGYTVNTADGEMVYGSLEQVREAYRFRLVNPDDLVREDESGKVTMARLLVAGQLSPTATAERPRDEQLGRRRWGVVAMIAVTILIAYVELRRLTVHFPGLLDVPFVIAVLPGAAPGGAIPFVSGLPAWLMPPQWLGMAHLGIGGLLLFIALRGGWAAPLLSGAFLGLVSTYLALSGRPWLSALVGATALGPLVSHTLRVIRRVKTRRQRRSPPRPPALQRAA